MNPAMSTCYTIAAILQLEECIREHASTLLLPELPLRSSLIESSRGVL